MRTHRPNPPLCPSRRRKAARACPGATPAQRTAAGSFAPGAPQEPPRGSRGSAYA
ncbi:hypothetical protein T492DRAFT_1023533 [Pavlovales sp. CCMP2436]|nr:hypothetical protein T492DRAFT_1023533 [Pavlovales sp. CCMP2436]